MKSPRSVFIAVHGVTLRRGLVVTLESLGTTPLVCSDSDAYRVMVRNLGGPPDVLLISAEYARSWVAAMDEAVRPRRVIVIGKGDVPLELSFWVPMSTCAWLPIDAGVKQLEATLQTVMHCQTVLREPRPAACGLCAMAKSLVPARVPLSEREQSILLQLSRGSGPQAIATGLGISVKTVESHVSRIKRKLGAQSSTELLIAAVAWRLGWLKLCSQAQVNTATPFLDPSDPLLDEHLRSPGGA